MRQARYVAYSEEMKNVYKVLVWKLQERNQMEDLGIYRE